MKIRHTPRVDTDLYVAWNAQSCRSVAAGGMADENPQNASSCLLWRQTERLAGALAQRIIPVLDDTSSVLEMLERMIEYESYRSTELYVLFAKEAEHEGFTEIADLFSQAAEISGKRVQALQRWKGAIQNETI